jgi:ATP/maltotriose-dependent transcriptional regulator MalT
MEKVPPLSDREFEVLAMLAQGLVKKEIGALLHIGYGTVATHIRHIYEKLSVTNAPAAIHKAHLLGLFHSK